MPTRREVLGLALAGGAAVGLAGCAGGPGATTDDEDTDTTTEAVPAPETVTVHRSVRTMGVAHLDVRGGLYVVAGFATEDAADGARSAATLVLDGESRDPVDRLVRPLDGGPGVAFEVPAEGVDAEAGRVRTDTDATALTDESLARLAEPPAFDLVSFSVPDAEASRETATAALAVANTGGSDGRFLAELGTDRLSDRGETGVEVPAEDRTSREESVDLHGRAESGSETVVLEWPDGTAERPVYYPDPG